MSAGCTAAARTAGATAGGFSLIELLVVVAIMSVLACAGFPLAELAHRRAQEDELRRALREIRSAIDAYKKRVDEGVIARGADASGYPQDLLVLVQGVPNARTPQAERLYFLRRLPRDPFAPAELQDAAQTWGLRSYASPPDDPQPGADVFDVHSKAAGTGLNGVPYRDW